MLAVTARLLLLEDGDSVDDSGLDLGDAIVELGLFTTGRLLLLIHQIEISRTESSILPNAKYSPKKTFKMYFCCLLGYRWGMVELSILSNLCLYVCTANLPII